MASGTASSAYGSRYTAWVYWNTLRVAVVPGPFASSSTATTLACWASSVTTPAPASASARRATPGGNAKVGRSRTPAERTGHSIGSVITTTPAVVPHASHASAAPGSASASSRAPWAVRANTRYAPITTSDDSSGPSAGHTSRRCAVSTPASTTPTPYSTTCGENTTSIRAASAVAPSQPSPTPVRRTSGPASSATSSASGVSTATAQVSSADAVRSTSARCSGPAPGASDRDSGPASSGTTAPASAPPATTSNSTLGSWLAVE